jgi:hypothetical protein
VVKPPSVREVTGWISRRPDHLVERDAGRLRILLDRCPELAAAADLVRLFADMLTSLLGDQLGAWTPPPSAQHCPASPGSLLA